MKNLKNISSLINLIRKDKIIILKEIYYLLDTISTQAIDYNHITPKHTRLKRFFDAIKQGLSGEKIEIRKSQLVHDLTRKYEWMMNHIRKSEWLPVPDPTIGHGYDSICKTDRR